jgi:hypothetical protein
MATVSSTTNRRVALDANACHRDDLANHRAEVPDLANHVQQTFDRVDS